MIRIGALLEARRRLQAAIRAGELTSYYSGGQGFKSGDASDEEESEGT